MGGCEGKIKEEGGSGILAHVAFHEIDGLLREFGKGLHVVESRCGGAAPVEGKTASSFYLLGRGRHHAIILNVDVRNHIE